MNKNLQYILDFIKNAEHLSEKEKADLTKSVKNADKEFTISEFKLERTEKVKKTTAILLEETIAELEQKRKDVEKHNRELEIEAALERVRSRSMGMHKSNELKDVAAILFEKLYELDIVKEEAGGNASIFLYTDPLKGIEQYVATDPNLLSSPDHFHIPYSDHPITKDVVNAKESGAEYFAKTYTFDEKNAFFKWSFENSDYKRFPDHVKKFLLESKSFSRTDVFSKNSSLFIPSYTGKLLSENEIHILKRFANVFDQAYIRFLDLQKAEAQAREAQIEAALERVRSSMMAMHKTEELHRVLSTVFEQLQSLGLNAPGSAIIIYDKDQAAEHWMTGFSGKFPESYKIPYVEHTYFTDMFHAWQKKVPFKEFFFEGDLKIQYGKWCLEYSDFKRMPPEFKKEMLDPARMVISDAFNKYGMLEIMGPELLSEESVTILKRFSKVFEQAYTRFLDIQKAEAQAREANIVAALERVRSLALGMRKSEEVGQVTDSFFAEFIKLTVKIVGCSIVVVDKKNDSMEIWRARSDVAVRPFSKTSLTLALKKMKEETPEWYEGFYKTLGSKSGYLKEELSDEKRLRFLRSIAEQSSFTPEEKARFIKMIPSQVVLSFLFFKLGYLALISEKELPQENLSIARRFADVFDFAYTRFIDLQKAEVQAKEAVKQASLDRVRGEIASMRTTEDLNRITPVIWRELITLEVPFIRCGVFIVNEANKSVGVFLTTPDGKALGVLHLAFDSNELTSNTVKSWQKNQVYKEHWNKEDFINWTKSMMKLGQVQNPETYQGSSQPPESLHLHFVPFTQGMLYVGNTSPLNEDKLELAKTLAEAFSIAYARYEDFKNLEEAKAAVENTLKELKSAQAQLVHSEKMASLGELTAGIAHEIKNPLNFVNNFSEVSGELLDEMKEELKNKNEEEVAALIEDLKQNLEKINQHGKRADSIVKGMLLHSRGTAGEKAPTDINDLLEQYVNLAYHGMRAQNKDFNIKIERDYDKTLEKVNVVPQDISRVFLNIINNGCYAANDKKKTAGDGFSPTIKVSSKSLNRKAEIRIKDNGNGVPEKIKDKLFQPFFTTKPTGEGTGLGLSLSYDIIVKQHGGEIKIDSREGEGAEFIIQLPYN